VALLATLSFLRAHVVPGCLEELLPHLDQFAHERRVYVHLDSVVR
jgi:hypothetical protein